jgi:hypothetical protein
MRWMMFAVLVAALALVGAGCGGGDDEGAGDTDTAVVTDTTTTEDTTTDETTTETTDTQTDTGTSDGLASGDCLSAVTAFGALSQAVAASSSSSEAEDAVRVFQEFANNAPEEIQDDLRVLADAYVEYIGVLTDLSLGAGDTPSADQIQQITQASEGVGCLRELQQLGFRELPERLS